jgi:hypothetical protein
MEDFFQGGQNWTQGVYHRPNGTKCLVGAANHVRESAIDDAKYQPLAMASAVPADRASSRVCVPAGRSVTSGQDDFGLHRNLSIPVIKGLTVFYP